jgi:RNA polymerase sigma factor (sigma-70 family)
MSTPYGPGQGQPDPGLSAIMSERRQLINLAYRLLGSLADAEDAVQETYARWYAMSPEQQRAIASPGAWLTKVASRVCLDLLGSARARRERYVGEWIPEPLPEPAEWTSDRAGGICVDPADRVTLDESVNMAFMVVLESMTPAERVAFILHDVFRYSFAEVAEVTGRTPAACRQLASSARHRIVASQPPAAPAAQQAGLVRDFKKAWEAKDINALIGLLDPEATATGDGGGVVTAALQPIEGAERIARFYVELISAAASVTFLERTVNGQPGLVAQLDGRTVAVYAFDVAGGRIRHIWAILNPDKLRPWTTGLLGCVLDEAAMVGYRAGDRPPDPPGGVRGKPVALGVIELFRRAFQAEMACLDKVNERDAATGESLGGVGDQQAIAREQLALGELAVMGDPLETRTGGTAGSGAEGRELTLRAASGDDPRGQRGLFLRAQLGRLVVRGVLAQPGKEPCTRRDGVVAAGALLREVLAELGVEIGHEQVRSVVIGVCACRHDAVPSSLSSPNG